MLIADVLRNQFIDNSRHEIGSIKRFIDNQDHPGYRPLKIIDNTNVD